MGENLVDSAGVSTMRIPHRLKPLRQKLAEGEKEERRINFVSSTRIDTADGPVYHVDIKEVPGTEKVTWIEKATQRDFAIGVSLGGVAVLAMMTLTGGAALPIAPSLLPFIGAVIGGISDFRRNDKELKEGVDIGPPKRFNRDLIKSALGYGFMAKLLLIGVSVAIAASGLPIPGAAGLVHAWAAGGGLLTQIGHVAEMLPSVIGWGAFAIGASCGAVKGSEIGYARMQREYLAAKTKNERPELGVSVTPEQSLGVPELVANVVAPTILPVGLAGDLVAATQSAVDQRATANERKAWHPKDDQKLGFTFTNAVTSHQAGERLRFDGSSSLAEQIGKQRETAAVQGIAQIGG